MGRMGKSGPVAHCWEEDLHRVALKTRFLLYRGLDIFPSQNPGFGASALSDRAERSRQPCCLAAEEALCEAIFAHTVTKEGFFAE